MEHRDPEIGFCDRESVVERVMLLEVVFREDIFLPEGFVEQSIVKGDVVSSKTNPNSIMFGYD